MDTLYLGDRLKYPEKNKMKDVVSFRKGNGRKEERGKEKEREHLWELKNLELGRGGRNSMPYIDDFLFLSRSALLRENSDGV